MDLTREKWEYVGSTIGRYQLGEDTICCYCEEPIGGDVDCAEVVFTQGVKKWVGYRCVKCASGLDKGRE